MDLYEIRRHLKTKTIYDLPLRVTYYARVSTEKAEQLNSLGNQVSYYPDWIRAHPNWTYVEGYVDEGITGIGTSKREDFLNMIRDGKDHRFDLIVTKEIPRFARNTVDSLNYTRDLLRHGVGVYFENDNLCTLDEDSEFRLTIMSGVAQDESRKLSQRVRWGHNQSINRGVVLGNSLIYGYVKDKGRLVVDERWAGLVRELFELYATDRYTLHEIEQLFWDKGYRNKRGNRLSHATMSRILRNPKYKGYYAGNKVKVVDMFTKEQKFLPESDWVVWKDESGETVPALVTEEVWARANAVLARRSEDVKGRQNKCTHGNLLTGKLHCEHCGAPFYRKDSRDTKGNVNSTWRCSGKMKRGKDSCPTFALHEDELKSVLLDVFKQTSTSADALVEQYAQMFEKLQSRSGADEDIAQLREKMDVARRKADKALEHNVSGRVSDEAFARLSRRCDEELRAYGEQLDALVAAQGARVDAQAQLAKVRQALSALKNDMTGEVIDASFVNQYIDQISVRMEDGEAQLGIRILTGDTEYRAMGRQNKSRTGPMMKKMIEAQERAMSGQR